MGKREREGGGGKRRTREGARSNVSITFAIATSRAPAGEKRRIHLHVAVTARCYARLSAASLAVNAVSGTA